MMLRYLMICFALWLCTMFIEAKRSCNCAVKNENTSSCLKRDLLVAYTEEQTKRQSYNMEKLKKRVTDESLEEVFESCHRKIEKREILDRKLVRRGRVVKSTDKKADLYLFPTEIPGPNFKIQENLQLVLEEVTELLIERNNLMKDDIEIGLPHFPLKRGLGKSDKEFCERLQPQPICNPNYRYRTADGSCNNLNNPTWGMAPVCQQRLRDAFYEGTSGYRTSVSGEPLPEPRLLSLNLNSHLNKPTNDVTHMHMFFGQLLTHDIVRTPKFTAIDSQPIDCCPLETETHPECRPVIAQQDDPFYSQLGMTCLSFVRAATCPTCHMGFRQAKNGVTSMIDASIVYDSSENGTRILRANDGTGRLRTQNSHNGPLMPRSKDPQGDKCSIPGTNDICFQTGDGRANQNTVLASLQTVLVREHNQIATELKRINPHWKEERLFQEARRIIIAQIQVITYKEYLPITLGEHRMKCFQLHISDTEATVYDPKVDPTIFLEFSTAAFRFGHSMINSAVARCPLNATNGRRLLRNEYFQPFDLYKFGFIGSILSSASNSPAQSFDQSIVEDVTNHLYRVRGTTWGLDLAAVTINRGRDVGMPPYVDMLRWCSLGKNDVRNFDDLLTQKLVKSEQVRDLRRIYRDVADVDLWIGILMEIPIDGALVGPTAACVIGLQFHNLKFGDRFYIEHRDQAGSFTFQQRMELKKTTLSSIMCRNSDAVRLPSNAMLFRSKENPSVDCSSVAGIDLSYWKE